MALKFLVEKLGDLVYAKDDDGETLLHWAARSSQFKIIEYLVSIDKVERESTNSMGRTAAQISEESSSVGRNEGKALLSGQSWKSALMWFWSSPAVLERLSWKREQTMVVMTLIATMAFQAAVSIPGGVWQEDTSSHRAGEAVIASTHPKIYKHLVRANTAAFVSSLTTIFLAVPQKIGKGFLLVFSSYVMWVSLASIAVSFGGSVLVSAPNTKNTITYPDHQCGRSHLRQHLRN